MPCLKQYENSGSGRTVDNETLRICQGKEVLILLS